MCVIGGCEKFGIIYHDRGALATSNLFMMIYYEEDCHHKLNTSPLVPRVSYATDIANHF
jgi:hypothetical protein